MSRPCQMMKEESKKDKALSLLATPQFFEKCSTALVLTR
jgi:hypothetical protein